MPPLRGERRLSAAVLRARDLNCLRERRARDRNIVLSLGVGGGTGR